MVALSQSDPCAKCFQEKESKEWVVAAAGELHLEVCLETLREYCGRAVSLVVSDPVVSYRESVASTSPPCLAKSQNKHNRLYVSARPLGAALVEDLERGRLTERLDVVARTRLLVSHGWDAVQARKIWSFGPAPANTNLLVDCCTGVQGLSALKDGVVAAFHRVCEQGVLCGERVRGVCFCIEDARLHSDGAHRRSAQIVPMAERAFKAAMLSAEPVLLEPVFAVEIQAPDSVQRGVYGVLASRRGKVVSSESFGFSADLQARTRGIAVPQLSFDHWQPCPGDPLVPPPVSASASGVVADRPPSSAPGTSAGDSEKKLRRSKEGGVNGGRRSKEGVHSWAVVREIRLRKGFHPDIPGVDRFLDKL